LGKNRGNNNNNNSGEEIEKEEERVGQVDGQRKEQEFKVRVPAQTKRQRGKDSAQGAQKTPKRSCLYT
jgi:hypothetical protein